MRNVSRGTVDVITLVKQWYALKADVALSIGSNERENLKYAIIDWRTDANLLLNESEYIGEYWTREISKFLGESLHLKSKLN